MPRMDGRSILRHIKSDGLLKKIPVVVLTTSREREDILETYNMGANIFFTKPNDFNGLLNLMETTKKYWLEMAQLPVE
jgi:two-component system response regulator